MTNSVEIQFGLSACDFLLRRDDIKTKIRELLRLFAIAWVVATKIYLPSPPVRREKNSLTEKVKNPVKLNATGFFI